MEGGMTTLELSPEELEALRGALSSHLGDLRVEISHTDARRMREELKGRESILRSLLTRLEAASGESGGSPGG